MSVTPDDGQPLDREDHKTPVILAIDEAKINGGDGYTMLMNLPELGDAGVLEEVFRAYLTKMTKEKGIVERWPSISRIRTVGVYEPKPYDASVHVTQNNRPAPGRQVVCCIDGTVSFQTVLGKDSTLRLTGLVDGPHTIGVEGSEVLVNNYSGAGLLEGGTAVSVSISEKLENQKELCKMRRRTAKNLESTRTRR